ncbi:hypothetical protein VTI28DRAFT_5619 [Corynascus sepedonium]
MLNGERPFSAAENGNVSLDPQQTVTVPSHSSVSKTLATTRADHPTFGSTDVLPRPLPPACRGRSHGTLAAGAIVGAPVGTRLLAPACEVVLRTHLRRTGRMPTQLGNIWDPGPVPLPHKQETSWTVCFLAFLPEVKQGNNNPFRFPGPDSLVRGYRFAVD